MTIALFPYLLVLRGGLVIRFEGASKSRNGWVTLESPQVMDSPNGLKCRFERGLEVRVSDIVAIADAPDGT